MMKRMIIYIALSMVLIITGSACSESGRMEDSAVFDLAVDMLQQTDNRSSVENAYSMFGEIASNYNQSKSFAIYASAILNIYDHSYDDAEAQIAVLEMNSAFSQLLEDEGLQPCGVLKDYILACRREESGDYIGAMQLYSSMSFLDSVEKSVGLISLVYNDAISLFNKGEYARAAEVFSQLGNYKDSAEMAENAASLISTPTVSVKPTATPMPLAEQIRIPVSVESILGHWKMTEVRKKLDDKITFDIEIISIDGAGNASLDWGGSGRIQGKWNFEKNALTVFNNQVYIYYGGFLAGGNQDFSGIAQRDGAESKAQEESIIGKWSMIEFRKDSNNDVIVFPVEILSIDESGKMTIDWGGSGRIEGQWDADKTSFSVHSKQVYVFQDGMIGGGNERYSGIAVRE